MKVCCSVSICPQRRFFSFDDVMILILELGISYLAAVLACYFMSYCFTMIKYICVSFILLALRDWINWWKSPEFDEKRVILPSPGGQLGNPFPRPCGVLPDVRTPSVMFRLWIYLKQHQKLRYSIRLGPGGPNIYDYIKGTIRCHWRIVPLLFTYCLLAESQSSKTRNTYCLSCKAELKKFGRFTELWPRSLPGILHPWAALKCFRCSGARFLLEGPLLYWESFWFPERPFCC